MMNRKYGVYYYNANKQNGNDLGLKLYSKDHDSLYAAKKDMEYYSKTLDAIESKFEFIILSYWER